MNCDSVSPNTQSIKLNPNEEKTQISPHVICKSATEENIEDITHTTCLRGNQYYTHKRDCTGAMNTIYNTRTARTYYINMALY